MKIVFAGGGTAGHVNPALAVAGYICQKEPGSQIWLSGGKGNIEEKLAQKAGYPIYTFPLKGLSRAKSLAGIKQTLKALLDMQKATGECKKILADIQPDVVMGTGGYASFPMVRAAIQLGIKTAVLEVLGDGKKRTVSELLKEVPDLPDTMTNQRMSAIVRQMVDAGQVVRSEDKRKAFFTIA